MMETMLEWALDYADRGLRVFPLRPGTKGGQLIRSWKKEATTDTGTIRAWWAKWPDAGIGIATGGGLTVIDLDVKHPPDNGIQSANDWQMANGFFPPTASVQTGSGGCHLYYWTPGGQVKSRTSLYPGVDIKGEGGYVVAPPSENSLGIYRWENSQPIAAADERVLSFVRGYNPGGKKMVETPEGIRNNTLRDQVWKLAHEYHDTEELLQAALAMNQKCIPPLEEDIIVKMVSRAVEKVQSGKNAEVISFADIRPEAVTWLWYPYIPGGKITILAGDAGVGKTFLEMALAALISKGQPFPGTEQPRDPGRVCILNTEDGLADTQAWRLRAAGADLGKIDTIDGGGSPLFFGDPRIEDYLDKYRPALMVFDPMQSFFGKNIDLNRSNETRPVFDQLLHLAQKYNAAIMVVMHLSKMTNAKAINRVLGSADIVGAARSVLVVANHPRNEGWKAVCHEKSNLAPRGESIYYGIEGGRVVWKGFGDLTADDCMIAIKDQKAGKLQAAKDLILNHMEDGRVKVADLYGPAEDTGISRKTLQRARAELGLGVDKKAFVGEVYWFKTI